MDIIDEVKEIITRLNNLEEYCKNLYHELGIQDSKEQDILHYIEDNKISAFEAYRLIKELKKVRDERRVIKNNYELLQVFNSNKNKIINQSNRQFLLQDLYVREKRLNSKYKNRQYTEEELKEIIK